MLIDEKLVVVFDRELGGVAPALLLPSPRPGTISGRSTPALADQALTTITVSMPRRPVERGQPAAPPPTTTTSVEHLIPRKLLIFQVNTAPLALTGVFLHHAVSIWAGG
jgi:hypothetical protein